MTHLQYSLKLDSINQHQFSFYGKHKKVPKYFLQSVFHITYALLKHCFLQSECVPVFSPVIAQYLPFLNFFFNAFH